MSQSAKRIICPKCKEMGLKSRVYPEGQHIEFQDASYDEDGIYREGDGAIFRHYRCSYNYWFYLREEEI
jgi:hypothetical protein